MCVFFYTFAGDIGGQSGLFLGATALSIFEVLDVIFHKPFVDRYVKNKKKKLMEKKKNEKKNGKEQHKNKKEPNNMPLNDFTGNEKPQKQEYDNATFIMDDKPGQRHSTHM